MTLKNLRRRASLAVGVMTTALVVPALAAVPAQAAGEAAAVPAALPQTVSADALPTVQINGVVWNQLVVGNTVYATGQFTSARPAGSAAGQNEVSRSNLLAYDIRTGNLISSWAPTLNGPGYSLAASADGKKIYVGGQFTSVNGTAMNRLVALDATTGAVVSGFRPRFDARVRSIAVVGNTVYAGGIFTSVGGTARTRLAAVDATSGALLPWNATADAEVMAMVVPSSKPELVIAGRFTTVNGSSSQGTAALDLSSGASLPWALPSRVRSGSKDSAVYSLSTDGTGVYGTAYDFDRAGNFENSFAAEADGGTLRWLNGCLGDTYGNWSLGGVLYTAGHTHDCSSLDGGIPEMSPRGYQHANASTTAASGAVNRQNAYGWAAGEPAPALLHWEPTFTAGSYTGQSQAAWSVAGNSQYLVYGGEFPTVNGIGQQGLVRFAVRSAAPGKEGPQGASDLTPAATTTYPGTVRLSWKAAWDRDDATLTYELLRGPAASPVVVATTTATSQWWNRPAVALSDPSAPTGSQTYRIRVTDPSGNAVTGPATAVAVPAADRVNAYADAVKADGASDYWRLGEARGAIGVSSLGDDDLLLDASEERGQAGALPDGDKATGFTGVTRVDLEGTRFGANYRAVVPATTTVARPGPSTYSTEVWFKTTTTSGGKLIGFGNSTKDLSSNYDRHVYMTDDGRLVAGTNGNGLRTVTSAKSYNDGQWHQAVATLGAGGLALYVDGVRVGRDAGARGGQAFDGYWRVGGDNTAWWPSAPTSQGFAGTLDDASVYPTELTRAQVEAHYAASGRTSAGTAAPADAYGKAVFTSDPELFWRGGTTADGLLADSGANGTTGVLRGGATTGAAGAPGTGGTGFSLDGVDGYLVESAGHERPSTYSAELWFSSTSTRGGKLIGTGNAADGYSWSNDRNVTLQDDGRLSVNVWTGQENRYTTPKAYNDGAWHHVVLTQGPEGLRLYVDGVAVISNGQTGNEGGYGYWRVGGDTTWGGTSSSRHVAGSVDEVAVYGRALSAAEVADHFKAAGGNSAPSAVFTATATGQSVAVDASASKDADGTIASYAWTFGDGGTATGATATHAYAAPGTYTVGLTTTDDKGAATTSQQSVPVRAATSTAPADAYGKAVYASGPDSYYRLDDPAGATTAADSSGLGNTGTVRAGVTTGAPGVSSAVGAGTGAAFSGQVGAVVIDPRRLDGPTTYSAELWFSTTSTRGGKIVGFGDGDGTGYSGSYDRHVIMNPDGTLHFGTWTGQANTVDTTTAYNDGKWHHLVATQGPAGMVLYVDGASVGTNPQTSAQAYTGSWRVGGDSGWGPLQNGFFDGSVDEVAFYSKVLGASTVADHHAKGTAVAPANQAPTAAFTSAAKDLAVSVDAAASSDADGTVASYAWTFGDGSTGTGKTAAHTYAAAGTYSVTLTVTDDEGATGTVTKSVEVGKAAPAPTNQAPTAAFTSTAKDLAVSVDGSTSADADGTVASYAWTFGDGGTGTGRTAAHTYAAAGTYPVTLVVTDDKGATASVTRDVVVSATAPATSVLAADAFGRTTSGGWGAADTGGTWTPASGASSFSVAPGAGRIVLGVAGQTRAVSLNGVSSGATDLQATFALDKAATGGGTYLTLQGRRVGADDYRTTARVMADGSVSLSLQRVVGGTTSTVRTATVPNLRVGAGQPVVVRLQVTGSGTTTLSAKAWLAGTTEPTAWAVTGTDTAASLQAAGGIGIVTYLSGSSTGAPTTVSVSDLKAAKL